MANVLITNSTYIKGITNISENVQDKYMFPSINEAQEIDLCGIIGETLLNKVKDLVADGSINDPENAVYKDLLKKCQFFIAYDVVAKLCVITSFKIDNAGVYRSNDENLYYASLDEVHNMEEYYQNKRDFFRLELSNFCINNRTLLPELTQCQCRKIRAQLCSAETCGIVLGGARGKQINYYPSYRD